MEFAVFFSVMMVLSFSLFFYFFDLFLFVQKESKAYDSAKDEREYLYALEAKHKKKRNRRKQNFLLYLIYLFHQNNKDENKANELLPFIKRDILLGIYVKKEADK